MRIPAVTNLKINAISGAGIDDYDSGMTNAIAKKKNGKIVATQRPSIDLFEDASGAGADARGRAIYRWASNNSLYIVNNNKIYKDSQSSVAIKTITAGTKRCKFLPFDTKLYLFDSENGEAWHITTGGTVTQITDTDFPTEQTPAIGLAYGAASLDKTLYVMDVNGVIYGSDLSDGTSWAALNFIDAERDPDGGTFIGKHHDNIVAFGPRSIEFFYDNANASGSPLNVRKDIAYTMGCSSGETVWETGDRMFFIGTNDSGALAVYMLLSFGITKISAEDLDSFITQAIVKDGYTAIGSGFSANGHNFYTITFYTTPSDISPARTIVYDDVSGMWYPSWTTAVGGNTQFPLVDWTVRSDTTARYGEGIFANGDLISINDNLIPQDTLLGLAYYASGYAVTGYVVESSDTGTPIPVTLRLGQWDGGISQNKTCPKIRYVGDQPANSQTLTVKWSNENNQNFTSGKSIDISSPGTIRKNGRFIRRNHEISHSATEILEIEALELDIEVLNA